MFLIAAWICERSGEPTSPAYRSRLRAMLEASRAMRTASGAVPRFGDADDGRILPLSPARPSSHDHLLWLGAAIAGTPPPPDPGAAGEAALIAGPGALAGGLEPRAGEGCAELADGGIWALRGREVEMLLRCGGVGQNGNGGHAHNDLCSYELHVGGVPVVVDPGTFTYTADPAARNRFRGTAAHGTVQVGTEEINPIVPERLFQMRPAATPRREEWSVDAERAVLAVAHDGYARLPQGVTHARRVELDRSADSVTVSDELRGSGRVDAVARIQLAAGTGAEATGDGVAVTAGGRTVLIRFEGGVPRLSEGAVSSGYGRRQPAPLIEVPLGGPLPLRAGHTIAVSR
jgi:hypothetical protein